MMHNIQIEESQLQLPNIKNNFDDTRKKDKINGNKKELKSESGLNKTGYKIQNHQLNKINAIIDQDLTMNHVVQHLSRIIEPNIRDKEQYYKEKETKYLFQGDIDEINQIENAQIYCEPVKRGNSLNYRIKAFGNDKFSKDEGKANKETHADLYEVRNGHEPPKTSQNRKSICIKNTQMSSHDNTENRFSNTSEKTTHK